MVTQESHNRLTTGLEPFYESQVHRASHLMAFHSTMPPGLVSVRLEYRDLDWTPPLLRQCSNL